MAYFKSNTSKAYLFIHVPKSGGTSINAYMFSKINDIFTFSERLKKSLKLGSVADISSTLSFIKDNILVNKKNKKLIRRWTHYHLSLSEYKDVFFKKELPVEVPIFSFEQKKDLLSLESQNPISHMISNKSYKINHILEIDKTLSKQSYNKAFKFSCIRNPKTRLVSHWLSHKAIRPNTELANNIHSKKENDKNRKYFNKWMITNYLDLMNDNFLKIENTISGRYIYREHPVYSNQYHKFLQNDNGYIDIDYLIDYDNINNLFENNLPLLNSGIYKESSNEKEKFYMSFYNKESNDIFEKYNGKDLDFYDNFKSNYKFKSIYSAIREFNR